MRHETSVNIGLQVVFSTLSRSSRSLQTLEAFQAAIRRLITSFAMGIRGLRLISCDSRTFPIGIRTSTHSLVNQFVISYKMPCTTALSHYVRESILKEWLALTFGGAETGSWSCEEIAHGENGYWQVTAPREITACQFMADSICRANRLSWNSSRALRVCALLELEYLSLSGQMTVKTATQVTEIVRRRLELSPTYISA
ncbi:Uncharacterized protein HZ326_11554 [Fusarium oxysporum f. sp. albedinis]|nr:Uncharacterized protein HZ326_11554 [Fusarium oxysporum f. sp. albedinis]